MYKGSRSDSALRGLFLGLNETVEILDRVLRLVALPRVIY